MRRLFARSVSAILGVAAAVAGNQILNGGVWVWWWIPIAIMLTLALGLVSELAIRRTELPLAVTDKQGRPPRFNQVRLTELGVHQTVYGPDGRSPYVPRDADDLLRAAVRVGGVLVVRGPRLAGTTRALAEAVVRELPEWRVVIPTGGSTPTIDLPRLIKGAARWAHRDGVVVWLERPQVQYLNRLDTALVRSIPTGMLVCLTCDTDVADSRLLPPEPARLLREDGDHRTVIEVDTLSEAERGRARAMPMYEPLRKTLDTTEEWWTGQMVPWWQFTPSSQPTDEETPNRLALLHVVTDWHRLQIPTPLTQPILRDLHQEYVQEENGTTTDDAMFTDALAWARRHEPPLVARVAGRHGTAWYVPHTMLEVADTLPQNPAGRPVSPVMWRYAARRLPEADRRGLGLACLDRQDVDHAVTLLNTVPANSLEPTVRTRLAQAQTEHPTWWHEPTRQLPAMSPTPTDPPPQPARNHDWWQPTTEPRPVPAPEPTTRPPNVESTAPTSAPPRKPINPGRFTTEPETPQDERWWPPPDTFPP